MLKWKLSQKEKHLDPQPVHLIFLLEQYLKYEGLNVCRICMELSLLPVDELILELDPAEKTNDVFQTNDVQHLFSRQFNVGHHIAKHS